MAQDGGQPVQQIARFAVLGPKSRKNHAALDDVLDIFEWSTSFYWCGFLPSWREDADGVVWG